MKFFVLAQTFTRHSAVPSEVMVPRGEVIDLNAVPGATLIAVDAAAVEAKAARTIQRQRSDVYAHEERLERRLRAELPKADRARLEALESALPETVAQAIARKTKKVRA